jgi:hypothetical protein
VVLPQKYAVPEFSIGALWKRHFDLGETFQGFLDLPREPSAPSHEDLKGAFGPPQKVTMRFCCSMVQWYGG